MGTTPSTWLPLCTGSTCAAEVRAWASVGETEKKKALVHGVPGGAGLGCLPGAAGGVWCQRGLALGGRQRAQGMR